MPGLGLNGVDAASGFRFDVTAAIAVVITAAVVLAFARQCLGRSRGAALAAGLLLVVNIALGCAVGPLQFVALWQLQWFVAWCAGLFLGADDVHAWLGRLLMSGWMFDALLIAAAVLIAYTAPDRDASRLVSILAWGCGLSLANRIAALPVGAHALWGDQPLRPAVSWMLLASLPPASILGLRLIELLQVDGTASLSLAKFLIVIAIAGALGSLRQESATRETAWRFSSALAGAAAVAIMIPAGPGLIVWVAAIVGCVLAGRLLPETSAPHSPPSAAPEGFGGRLELAAAREWNLPQLWRFAVAMPLRGGSQVLRFVDGLLFEQLPMRMIRKIDAATTPVRRAIPEPFNRLMTALSLAAAFTVLLAMAFR